MKISKLIAALEYWKKEYGDIEVRAKFWDDNTPSTVDDVKVEVVNETISIVLGS